VSEADDRLNRRRLEEAVSDLRHPNPIYRGYAVNRLRGLGAPEAAAVLTQALDDPDAGVRDDAALSLSMIAQSATDEPLARHLLTDPADHVRCGCALALGASEARGSSIRSYRRFGTARGGCFTLPARRSATSAISGQGDRSPGYSTIRTGTFAGWSAGAWSSSGRVPRQ
jgi:HEAT repeat protein